MLVMAYDEMSLVETDGLYVAISMYSSSAQIKSGNSIAISRQYNSKEEAVRALQSYFKSSDPMWFVKDNNKDRGIA
jgi:hypothetical protein